MTSLRTAFKGVDWSFSDQSRRTDLDGLHPYPAKFIAEIPATFIERLEIPLGTFVLDPFSGSGTTLVQGQRFGLRTIGVDLNPIACLMGRVKTSPLPDGVDLAGRMIQESLDEYEPSLDWFDSIPNVDHWFESSVKERLGQLTASINRLPDSWHDCANLALSSIVVKVSRQDSDTRYAAVENDVSPSDVDRLFLNALEKVIGALRSRDYELVESHVVEGDALRVDLSKFDQAVGAIITSPPYPNAYEYWLYHKYRMYWLGLDPAAVKDREIGARAHFFKKNGHTAETFRLQISEAFATWSALIHPDGWIAIVVGRSKIHGEIVDNASMIQEVARTFGFEDQLRVEREILKSRKSFNLAHAKISSESVLVMRR